MASRADTSSASADRTRTAAVLEALAYAAEQHRFQRRRGYDRLPYVNHLIKVVEALVRIGNETDPDVLQAAALHDVLEDTETTYEDLARRFGSAVADIVRELTDDMRLPEKERRRLQREGAGTLSHPAKKIRLVDKACNMRDLVAYPVGWTAARKLGYVASAVQVVERLGSVDERLERWFGEVVAEVREGLSL